MSLRWHQPKELEILKIGGQQNGSSDIRDAVDLAAEEIAEGKAFVKIDGKYVAEPPKKDVVEEDTTEEEIKE